jgi:hypothetical protein
LPKRLWIIASLCVAVATLNTPAILPAIALAVFYLALKFQNYRYLVPAILSGLFIAVENLLKFKSLIYSPYLQDAEKGLVTVLPYSGMQGFSYPLFFGILSILLSFGKGIIFYLPGLLLLFNAKVRERINLRFETSPSWIIFGVLLIAVYAKWWGWYGGNYWGPRFFLVFTFPASLALAVFINHPFKRKLLLLSGISVLILSFWVGIDGYIFGQLLMSQCWQDNYALEFLCWYVPEYSALWRPFVTGEIYKILSYERAPFAIWQVLVLIYLVITTLLNYRNRPTSV